MKPRSLRLPLAVFALLALGAALLLQRGCSGPPSAPQAGSVAQAESVDPADDSAPTRASVFGRPPTPGEIAAQAQATANAASALDHPAPGVAVREVLDALDARARAGDALAACRLVSELILCRQARAWTESAEQSAIDRLAAVLQDGDDIADSAAQLQNHIDINNRRKAACEGITDADLGRTPDYAFAAAMAGHVPSMSYFAAGVEVNGERIVADPALYQAYRQHAWPMFLRALEAGHPHAVHSWSWALNSGGYAYFSGVIPPEWRTPGVAALLNQRLRAEQGLEPAVPAPADTPIADRLEADALYQRYFQNSRWLQRNAFEPPPPRRVEVPKYELDLKHCEPQP